MFVRVVFDPELFRPIAARTVPVSFGTAKTRILSVFVWFTAAADAQPTMHSTSLTYG